MRKCPALDDVGTANNIIDERDRQKTINKMQIEKFSYTDKEEEISNHILESLRLKKKKSRIMIFRKAKKDFRDKF